MNSAARNRDRQARLYCVSLFAESETQRPLLLTGETQSRLWITFRRK